MKKLLFLLMVCFAVKLSAQAPFAYKTKFHNTSTNEFKKKVKKSNVAVVQFARTNQSYKVGGDTSRGAIKAATDGYNQESKKKEQSPDIFSQFGGGLVIGDDANTLFPTVNGDIFTYRLNLWSKVVDGEDGEKDTIRHYLPLSIISKVSGSNQNNTGTINDAVSFFGAPLTFRLSPVLYQHEYAENRIVIGMHHDLRILAIGDTNTNKIQAGFGYYGALGFTYFGIGNVNDGTDPDTRINGQWSFSSLVYFFKSGGKFNQAVFGNYENKSLSGLELLLRFKTNNSADSKFNLMLGANYGFTKGAPNYSKWDFRIGLGN